MPPWRPRAAPPSSYEAPSVSLTRATLLRRGAAGALALLLPLPNLDFLDEVGATTISVAAGTGGFFMAGDLLHNELTGELLRVESIHGDSLTISRAEPAWR